MLCHSPSSRRERSGNSPQEYAGDAVSSYNRPLDASRAGLYLKVEFVVP